MGEGDLREERREARGEAAPFAGAILVANLLLAVGSRRAGWELFGARIWWLWLLLAVPSALLCLTLVLGPRRVGLEEAQRRVAIGLLGLLGLGTATATLCVVVSLARWTPTGPQLLASALVVLLTNVVTFALVFWELDDGGPVARTVSPRAHPDFQFPQDENPELAATGWYPRLEDYVYVALTDGIAFSPTDAMPLTRGAKALMALDSTISVAAILLVAARAVNVLGS